MKSLEKTIDIYKKNKRQEFLNIRKEFTGSKKFTYENISEFENIPDILTSSGKIICGYYPMNDEIDILPLLKYLAKKNTILIPKVIKGSRVLEFGKIDFNANIDNQVSIDNSYKIKEPLKTLVKEDLHIDYMLTPALAIDKSFHRIGYGGGYYDNTLNFYININKSLISIGICLSDCYLSTEEFLTESHDMNLTSILTEKNYFTNNKEN